MSETLLRQWTMLRAIPRHPRKVSAAELRARLGAAGYRITKRSVERDLQLLSGVFPLVHDGRSIPYGWSWAAKAPDLELPALDASGALTLNLAQRYAGPLLPPVVARRLAPQFQQAERVLRESAPQEYRRWSNAVRVVPREMALLPPKGDPEIERIVMEALFESRALKVRYASRSGADQESEGLSVASGSLDRGGVRLAGDAAGGGRHPQKEKDAVGAEGGTKPALRVMDAIVHPLALVLQGPVLYLVATFWDFEDPRHLAVHRIRSAEKLAEPAARVPKGFELDAYLAGSPLEISEGKMIRLEALFERFTAQHLRETPLSVDQTMRDEKDGRVRVVATMRESERLVWWLLGFGGNVEVVGPRGLRERVREEIRGAGARYEREARGR